MEMERLFQKPIGNLGQPFDPIKYAHLKADSYNKESGSLTGYDCPDCLNRGKIAYVREDGTVAFKDCDCMKIRRYVQKAEASGLGKVLDRYTFDTYTAGEEWQEVIRAGAEQYAADPDGWLLFCGQSGCGKTHLCAAVCQRFLEDGQEVRYMPWRADVAALKSATTDGDRRAEMLSALQQAPVLFIDDLFKVGRTPDGSRMPSAADIGIAFDLINYRYTKQLRTIISTERHPAELVEIDEATGGRILEMSARNTFAITERPGRNYRLRDVVTV